MSHYAAAAATETHATPYLLISNTNLWEVHVTLMWRNRIRRRVPQHVAAIQARCCRCQRRISQIMERKHTECYASCHTGRPSRIRQNVRYCPIPSHWERSRKASTERSDEYNTWWITTKNIQSYQSEERSKRKYVKK